mmetsp:Transcript_13925/g.37414  ORF Transcript_13925/g.37414 Transcript_13925/m.37414 type:complete len:343 (+) Transcript_13925:92-1120(+)
MVSTVTPEQSQGIVQAVVFLVNRDFNELTALYKRLGFIPVDEPVEPIIEALNEALPDALNSPVSELNLKNVISKLGVVFFEYPFSLPPFYTAVIRCLGVLEGVALQADASFPVIKSAYPFIASKLLTDPSPELQRALLDLLRKRDGRDAGAHLVHLVSLLEQAMDITDPLTLTERLASLYLVPEHAPLVRELMEQAVDMLEYLAVTGAGKAGTDDAGETRSERHGSQKKRDLNDEALRRTAQAVQSGVDGMQEVLAELAAGSQPARDRAGRVSRAILAEPMGQQFVLEFGLKLGERAALRSAATLLDWPEEQLPYASSFYGASPPRSSVSDDEDDADDCEVG